MDWMCVHRCDRCSVTNHWEHWALTSHFRASLNHKDDGQKKFIKAELTKIRYNNQVLCKYWVDPQRAGFTLIAELTWSNLGLKGVLNKRK